MSEAAITVSKVSKNFRLPHERKSSLKQVFTSVFSASKRHMETQHALRDVSFEVKPGEFFGIVGRNGSGKSTLLKMLAGIYQPTKGSIAVRGKLVPFIELGVGFNPELTGRENVFLNGALLGFSTKEIAKRYDEIVAFAELEQFMDQKLKNYSSGMQVRLAFSVAIMAEADILLVDEVLAVGDAAFQRKCFEYFRLLKRNKKTVVFVTHDMTAVREYCDRGVLIESSRVVAAGKADIIASEYSKLFLENAKAEKGANASSTRWGDGAVRYTAVRIKQSADRKQFTITATAKAERAVDSPNFGFLLRNSGGTAILGTNTHIKKQFIDRLEAGQKVDLEWQFDNILSDGHYFVEPAIVHSGAATADWWEEAASIEVRKEEQVPYPVNPPIEVTVSTPPKVGRRGVA